MKIKTVTIGIPAHNEEKNIAALLDSILSQKGTHFIISKIIVACDGCVDTTAKIVTEYKKRNTNIDLIDDGKRLGQAKRLNLFYKNLQSDIFITFDGDVTLGDRYVISELVKPFEDKRVGLVGGYTIPYPQHTFIGKCLEAYECFWRNVVKNVRHGESVHSYTGPISAGSKEFLTSVDIPSSIVANDHFLYFTALKKKFLFKSVPKAYVYMRVPTVFSDFMKQHTRFISSAEQIKEYFGTWVEEEYEISYTVKLFAYLLALVQYPVFFPLAVLLFFVRSVFAFHYKETSKNGLWTAIASSK